MNQFLRKTHLSVVLAGLLCGCSSFEPASPSSTVQANANTFQAIAAQEVAVPSRTEAEGQLQVPATLHKPGGDGPFPALVFLVGSEGVADPAPPVAKQHAQWIDRLVGWGYVVLVVDSFTPRGMSVTPDMRSLDSYAAKTYLSTLPFVDRNKVGVIGWSHGGWTIMTIIDAFHREKTVSPFRVAVAFYPRCHPLVNPDTPVLVLIGRKDQQVRPDLAESLARDYRSSNWKQEFSLTVYPNATHGFDIEGFEGGFDFAGSHMEYDPTATDDAIGRTQDFLAKYLRAK